MDNLEIIAEAHRVHASLGRLATSLIDEELREQVRTVQSTWRELVFSIDGAACGLAVDFRPEPAKKRGRKKKAEREELIALGSHEATEKSGTATSSHTPIAS